MVRRRSSSVKVLHADEVREEDVDVTFLVWLVARATSDLLDDALLAEMSNVLDSLYAHFGREAQRSADKGNSR